MSNGRGQWQVLPDPDPGPSDRRESRRNHSNRSRTPPPQFPPGPSGGHFNSGAYSMLGSGGPGGQQNQSFLPPNPYPNSQTGQHSGQYTSVQYSRQGSGQGGGGLSGNHGGQHSHISNNTYSKNRTKKPKVRGLARRKGEKNPLRYGLDVSGAALGHKAYLNSKELPPVGGYPKHAKKDCGVKDCTNHDCEVM